MNNLIRMDLYRMTKSKTFRVCLLLAFLFGCAMTPFSKLLSSLAAMIPAEGGVVPAFPTEAPLSSLLRDPFPMVNGMLTMLSICSFYFADLEFGYVKNIAGQMPRRSCTVLSKFLVSVPHTLIFIVAGLIGRALGTVFFQTITVDPAVMDGLRVLGLKFLLMEGICAILLLAAAGVRSKSLGTVLSVLMGTGLLVLFYSAVDMGLQQIPFLRQVTIQPYMPDQLLDSENPETLRSVLAAAVCVAVFLPLSIRVFDKRDIK